MKYPIGTRVYFNFCEEVVGFGTVKGYGFNNEGDRLYTLTDFNFLRNVGGSQVVFSEDKFATPFVFKDKSEYKRNVNLRKRFRYDL